MSINNLTIDQVKKLQTLNHIHVSWRDYALMLLNSTAEPLRSIWQEKVVASYSHWNFEKGSISEGNILGCEIMTILPNSFTEAIVDDHFDHNELQKCGRLTGSKRMNIRILHYPQESSSNEAALCLKWICDHWDEKLPENVSDEAAKMGILLRYVNPQTETYADLIMGNEKLRNIWKFAQMGNGHGVSEDEVLTWILDRPVDDDEGFTAIQVSIPVLFKGPPEGTVYGEYWKTTRLGDYRNRSGEIVESDDSNRFPQNCASQENLDRCNEILNGIIWNPEDPDYHGVKMVTNETKHLFETYKCGLSHEEQVKNFKALCDTILKENVAFAPCWKKICICILKNDVSFKYAGFAPTYRERQAREEAMEAFDAKKKADAEAKRQALAQAKEIEERNSRL